MSAHSIGKRVALRFLRNYAEFGSRGHLFSARALQERMRSTENSDERKLLAVKVYAEFIAALEDLGALCIAICHRNEGVGLVYSYLTYGQPRKPKSPKTTVKQMFEMTIQGNALTSALQLPSLTEISKLAPESPVIPQLYKETDILLTQAANAYLLHDSAFVRAYNKTKHGFVVVSDEHAFQPDDPHYLSNACWIVSDNPEYDPDKAPTNPVVELFLVEEKNVDPMVERIGTIRGAVVTLCELTANLLEKDIITSADDKA